MRDPKVERLAKIPLFAKLGHRELEQLAAQVDEVSIKAGETLIAEGQPTEAFYILTGGKARVTRAGKPVADLGPGDFFGEIGMLDNGPATATVVADGAGEAMVLSHVQFRDAIKGNDKLALQVLAAVAERLRAIELGRRSEP
ncbi:MAG TPA: cyclic nucleotide-binding domain-containing protein [Candidatus Dormibacteraeota bacterium]